MNHDIILAEHEGNLMYPKSMEKKGNSWCFLVNLNDSIM